MADDPMYSMEYRGLGGRFSPSSSRFAAQLIGRQNYNNGTHAGGIATVAQNILQAMLLKDEMNKEAKLETDTNAANNEMVRGMTAQPWVNPDTGQKQGTAGGYEGGIAALGNLQGNPYAGKLSQALMMGKMERDQKVADMEGDRGFRREMFGAEQGALDRRQNAGFDFQRGQTETQQQFQKGMQGSQFENQNQMQDKLFGQQKELQGLKANAEAPGLAFQRADKLRDEYNNLTKDFRTVQDAYSKIKSTSDSGAGDMSLLYSYVKLLDPGSVVRESEFATAAASGSLGERMQGAVNRIMSGERLPESLRNAFKGEAESLYKAQKGGADRLKTHYTDLAGRYGINAKDVIQDYSVQESEPSNDDPLGLRKH